MLIAPILLLANLAEMPPVIRPAPDPWPTPAQACRLLENETKWFGHREARGKGLVVEVEQIVDCDGRIVTRVYAATSRRVVLDKSAQDLADLWACFSPRNQTLYERDHWSFRVVIRGTTGSAAASATAQGVCMPRYPFNDEPHERGMPE
jgi:hypothetical protein